MSASGPKRKQASVLHISPFRDEADFGPIASLLRGRWRSISGEREIGNRNGPIHSRLKCRIGGGDLFARSIVRPRPSDKSPPGPRGFTDGQNEGRSALLALRPSCILASGRRVHASVTQITDPHLLRFWSASRMKSLDLGQFSRGSFLFPLRMTTGSPETSGHSQLRRRARDDVGLETGR